MVIVVPEVPVLILTSSTKELYLNRDEPRQSPYLMAVSNILFQVELALELAFSLKDTHHSTLTKIYLENWNQFSDTNYFNLTPILGTFTIKIVV